MLVGIRVSRVFLNPEVPVVVIHALEASHPAQSQEARSCIILQQRHLSPRMEVVCGLG
jgi:hypothetical protein